MSSGALLNLASALLGGAAVAVVTYLANRNKTKAETAKLEAETDRVRAETATLIIGSGQISGQQAPLTSQISGQQAAIPGWQRRGSRPDDYNMTLDRTVAHSGSASALIEAQPGARGFGTLMQELSSITMRGKRIRLSAFVKTEDVEWAALWMRVDGPEDISTGFDNMSERPIKGTKDWHKCEIVLDVDKTSLAIAFGILLASRGRAWVDDFNFEQVGSEVPTTDMLSGTPMLPKPWNLDFEG